jgi:hypothetical protein
MSDKTYIYILRLEEDNYFIDKSKHVENRLRDHIKGIVCPVTKKYKPIGIKVIGDCYPEELDLYIKKYMLKYGIGKIRGGNHKNLKIGKEELIKIKHELGIMTKHGIKYNMPDKYQEFLIKDIIKKPINKESIKAQSIRTKSIKPSKPSTTKQPPTKQAPSKNLPPTKNQPPPTKNLPLTKHQPQTKNQPPTKNQPLTKQPLTKQPLITKQPIKRPQPKLTKPPIIQMKKKDVVLKIPIKQANGTCFRCGRDGHYEFQCVISSDELNNQNNNQPNNDESSFDITIDDLE